MTHAQYMHHMKQRPNYVPMTYLQNGTQSGGFAIAPVIAAVTAVHHGLQKWKPFTKLGGVLESVVPERYKNTKAYKVAHSIIDVAKKTGGYGNEHKKRRRTTNIPREIYSLANSMYIAQCRRLTIPLQPAARRPLLPPGPGPRVRPPSADTSSDGAPSLPGNPPIAFPPWACAC